MSREERLFMFLSSNLNKSFCYFLQYILPIFESPNTILQSRIPQIHILHSIFTDLFKNILSKFVKPSAIKSATSIFKVDYHSKEKQKENCDLVIGSKTEELLCLLNDTEKDIFFDSVRKYFIKVCDYIIHKFPVNSDVLLHARVACLSSISDSSFKSVLFFTEKFPVLLNINEKDKHSAIDELHSEFCSLQLEDISTILNVERIDTQWGLVGQMKSSDGVLKYKNISSVMLGILTVPHSNSECERIFSMVTKTRTQFRSNLSDDSLETILIAKSMQQGMCYEQQFDHAFLQKAKSASTTK